MSDSPCLASDRDESIRWAVWTSILSKVGTLLLRLISIPVAIRVLGMEEFGVYATILIVVQMMDVFHIGIGPALTSKLSKAVLKNDTGREGLLFSTGILISTGLTLLVAVVLAMVVWQVPIVQLFGEKYRDFSGTMRSACFMAIIIIAIELICMVAERARDGYMETRFTNAWGAGGNFLGAVLLLTGIYFFPTIEFLILAVNGSVVLAKLGNMIHMLIQRPYLFPSLKRFSPCLLKGLLSGGLIFTIVYSTNCISEYNVINYMVGRYLGPAQAANYSVLVTLHLSLSGLITILTVPMWPAIIDAYERGDLAWVRKAEKRLRLAALSFGSIVILGMSSLGPWVMNLWIGDQFGLGRLTLLYFGIYFALHLWRIVNQVLCIGLSREKPVALVILAEAGTYLMATWALLRTGYGIHEILLAVIIAMICFSGWLFPLIYHQTISASRNGDFLRGKKTAAVKQPELAQV